MAAFIFLYTAEGGGLGRVSRENGRLLQWR